MTETKQLLREYVASGSESAFAEIVRRYVDLVHSVAFRRVGGDECLARDVVQSVFTDLARKARRLRAESTLGGWLHRHTCFVASSLLRAERRRQARERIAAEMNNEPSEAAWQRLAPVLDEAIDELGEPDRQAIVLRFYERCDLRSVGRALGANEDAAQKRVSRAVEKLRALLAKKGVTLSTTVVGALLTSRAVTAAPAGIASDTITAALSPAGAAGVLSSLITMTTSLGLKLAVGAAAAALIGGALLFNWTGRNGKQVGAPATVSSSEAAAAQAAALIQAAPSRTDAAEASAEPLGDRLRLTILSAESGEPLPRVEIYYRGWEGETFSRKHFISNRSGVCNVAVPRATTTRLELTSVAEGYADTRLEWQMDQGDSIPPSYALRLQGATPIGGRVLDAEGRPVAGAKMGWNHQDDVARPARPEGHEFGWIEVETDADGRWRINRIAADMLARLYGSPRHPDYVSPPLLFVSQARAVEEELKSGAHVFHLGRALSISGMVVDPDGKPVPGANVWVGGISDAARRDTQAGLDGAFTVGGCKPGRNVVTAEASGFTAGSVALELGPDSGPVTVKLQRGRTLRLRVVDTAGAPVAGANVWYDTLDPRGNTSSAAPPVQVEFSPRTDADGRAVWEAAPEGEHAFSFHKPGFMRRDRLKIRTDGEEHVVTLSSALVVSGTIVDAATGSPIAKGRIGCAWPSTDISGRVTPRFSNIDRFWLSFSDGKFKHSFEEPLIMGMPANPGYMLKFEADGYAPVLSRVIKEEEGQVHLEVTMERAPHLGITVLLPDGELAAGVEVAFITPGTDLRLAQSGFSRLNTQAAGDLLKTDPNGRFQLSPDSAVLQVAAASSAGYASVNPALLRETPTLQLQPWGRIQGAFASGPKAAGRTLNLLQPQRGPAAVPLDLESFRVQVDADGRFEFTHVPPGKWLIARSFEAAFGTTLNGMQAPLQDVDVQAGQTAQVVLGANARLISMRLRLPADLNSDNPRLLAALHTPLPVMPAELRADPAAAEQWRQSPEVQSFFLKARHCLLQATSDGVWSGEEVTPGEYVLSVSVFEDPSGSGSGRPYAFADVPVTVPGSPDGAALDLGEITLQSR